MQWRWRKEEDDDDGTIRLHEDFWASSGSRFVLYSSGVPTELASRLHMRRGKFRFEGLKSGESFDM